MANLYTSRSDLSSATLTAHAGKRPWLCALGVVVAALVFELGLHPFVADSDHLGIRTVRSYFEGISVAHFDSDRLGQPGNRLTGNVQLSRAREGLIVGDSHVVANAVRDEETMGAVVERLSRNAGHPLNVRQYGWHGANAATLLAAAESLRDRHPAWVAVVLNSYTIGVNALVTLNDWRMEVATDGSCRLVDGRAPPHGRWGKAMRQVAGHSTFVLALWRRIGLIENRLAQLHFSAKTAAEPRDHRLAEESGLVPRATVLGLKRVLGGRLMIVYAPPLLGPGHYPVEPAEMELQRRCQEEDVAFLSVREALDRDRSDHSRLSRGFHNTAPGVGHFNAIGHRIIGEEIWRYLCAHSSFGL
jgi:hypothetical protein